jgi:predicted DNA-binding transcriptional regulator AlpA
MLRDATFRTVGYLMRLLVFNELKSKKGIPYTRQHIHRLIKIGRFPKPFKPNGGPFGINAWDETAIDEFQEHCKQRTAKPLE